MARGSARPGILASQRVNDDKKYTQAARLLARARRTRNEPLARGVAGVPAEQADVLELLERIGYALLPQLDQERVVASPGRDGQHGCHTTAVSLLRDRRPVGDAGCVLHVCTLRREFAVPVVAPWEQRRAGRGVHGGRDG
jgi:hypothetical protein